MERKMGWPKHGDRWTARGWLGGVLLGSVLLIIVSAGTALGQGASVLKNSTPERSVGQQPAAAERAAPEEAPAGAEEPAAESAPMTPQPCSFQQVTPGQSTVEEVLQRLGEPKADSEGEGARTLLYQVDPFEKVELVIEEGVVVSIVLYLREPVSPTQIERELELDPSWATDVVGESGQLMGRAYPERGVLLNFAAGTKSHRAQQVVLEPISLELFVLRAKQDRTHQFERNVADLQFAWGLDQTDADVAAELAKQLSRAGKFEQAWEVVEETLQLVPANQRLVLARAELHERMDRLEDCQEQLSDVLQNAEEGLVKARAEKLQGDLLAEGPARDFARAVEHHLAAVKAAAPLATDKRPEVRREAKELLLELFLAAALDIASGEWQDKEATTAKWLASARELANSLMSQEQADEWPRLQVTLGTLAAYAELGSSASPETLVSSVTRDMQKLNDASGDAWCRRELDLLKVRALFDAASIAHRREKPGQARDFALQAINVFESLKDSRPLDPREKYLLGRLYFFAGSAVAVSAKNHEEAVRYYSKARRFLVADPPTFAALDLARQGERFVSMGASYFESGEQELGLKLTRDGLETMKEASDAGLIDEATLALPYNNLAAMYRVQGKSDEAKALAETAAKLTPPARQAIRR